MLPLLSCLLLLPLALGDQGAGHAPHHVSHHALSGHHAPPSSIQATAPYSQPAVSLPLESEGQEYTYPAQGQYTQASPNYAPATGSDFGYSYDDPLDQENEVDSVSDKQGITNPAAFIPLIGSLSLPLGAAVVTFMALVSVAAAFLLFPQTVDVDVNTSNTRERSVRSVQDNSRYMASLDMASLDMATGFKDNSLDMATGFKDNSLNMATGFCAHSSSTVCKLLNAVLISEECIFAASCEVASMTNSNNFPVMANIVRPLMSRQYYDRFKNVDCSSLKCDLRKFY